MGLFYFQTNDFYYTIQMPVQIKEIDVRQLNELINEYYDFQLVDVREPDERKIAHLGGELIPMERIPENIGKISRERPVIIYCHTGRRSVDAIFYLQTEHGFDNLYNLKGGIHAWASEIDITIQKY